ncbi:class I SAM-dependent methyltransferase [Actinoplanes sp. NPDC049596]|uniref:class I SAM-dependent methyltransferase n=1 Tax=Actinoplanes sp. NPDC049596 TaxID=3154625 RepID=UPI003420718B
MREPLLPHLYRAAGVRAGERVLDVGCGCGDTTVAFGRVAGDVVGVDVSEPLLDVARRVETGNVRFVRADAQTCALGSFDVVVSSFGVMFFDDPVAAFRNLRGTGGRLAFLCWQDALVNEVFAIPLRVLGGRGGVDPFADPGWIEAMLLEAGYVDVRVAGLRETVRLGADARDVTAYSLGSAQVRELAGDLGQAARKILGAFRERERPDGVWVEAAAWSVTAAPGG